MSQKISTAACTHIVRPTTFCNERIPPLTACGLTSTELIRKSAPENWMLLANLYSV